MKLRLALTALVVSLAATANGAEYKLLNVSYDPTRELYSEYNKAFTAYYEKKTGDQVTVSQSHGGSGAQARSVIDGSPADVVSLALSPDIDIIADSTDLLDKDWESKYPNDASPYTSTIVFLVRKGNPKGIHDWNDLVEKEGVEIITPNPKTSGAARYSFLAAYAYADQLYGGDEAKIKEYLVRLFARVPVLDTGARGSTNTFVQRKIGDVLLAWENEAYLSLARLGKDNFELVTPSLSILAKPPVAIVTKNARAHGTEHIADEYIKYLYSEEAQEIIARNFYRPSNPQVLARHKEQFSDINLVDVSKYGGFRAFSTRFFDDGGWFDQIQQEINR